MTLINNVPSWIIYIFLIAGFVGITASVIAVAIVAKDSISDMIGTVKLRHKQKHRFDKHPTAKCCCVDCIHYRDGKCTRIQGRHIKDCYFCWEAEPKELRDEKYENSRYIVH